MKEWKREREWHLWHIAAVEWQSTQTHAHIFKFSNFIFGLREYICDDWFVNVPTMHLGGHVFHHFDCWYPRSFRGWQTAVVVFIHVQLLLDPKAGTTPVERHANKNRFNDSQIFAEIKNVFITTERLIYCLQRMDSSTQHRKRVRVCVCFRLSTENFSISSTLCAWNKMSFAIYTEYYTTYII